MTIAHDPLTGMWAASMIPFNSALTMTLTITTIAARPLARVANIMWFCSVPTLKSLNIQEEQVWNNI